MDASAAFSPLTSPTKNKPHQKLQHANFILSSHLTDNDFQDLTIL